MCVYTCLYNLSYFMLLTRSGHLRLDNVCRSSTVPVALHLELGSCGINSVLISIFTRVFITPALFRKPLLRFHGCVFCLTSRNKCSGSLGLLPLLWFPLSPRSKSCITDASTGVGFLILCILTAFVSLMVFICWKRNFFDEGLELHLSLDVRRSLAHLEVTLV